jgi:glycosyltransferase involved in cell wall biosynthesis
MRELNIFTYSFPYGSGEQFLYEEILILSKDYDKINVFPLEISNKISAFNLPKNVSVYNFENGNSNNSSGPFFKALSSEFSRGKHIPKYISKLRYYAAHFKNANSQAENLLSFLKEHKINLNSIFYTYWFNDWTYRLAILKEKKHIKHLVTRIHGGDVYEYQHEEKNYFFPFRNFQIQQLDKIFPISKDGSDHLKTAYPSSASKLQLARLGTKDHGLNPISENKKEFTIISCSTFYHYKNVGRIPEILSQLEFPIKWIHIGNDGPEKESVLDISKNLPTNIHVEFKGHLTQLEIFDFYKNTPIDLFINVSKSEGLPVTLMEAISFGIPIMAPNVGGIKEITNENTGVLFDPNDTNTELTQTIVSLKEKPLDRKKIRKFWEDNFNAEKNYTEFSQNLKKVA